MQTHLARIAELCGVLRATTAIAISIDRSVLTLPIIVLLACTTEWSESGEDASRPYMIERSIPPDTGDLPAHFRKTGGPVLVHLTGWGKPEVVEELERSGMLPLPGYARVERMDSMGLNVIGGVIPPGRLDRIAALRYVVRIEPAR